MILNKIEEIFNILKIIIIGLWLKPVYNILSIILIIIIIGLIGFIRNKENIIIRIMGLEIVTLSLLVIWVLYNNMVETYVYVLLLLTISAIEIAIGLSMIIKIKQQ